MKILFTVFFLFLSSSLWSQTGAIVELQKILSSENAGINTDAVIIYKDGKKLYEAYHRGYHEGKKHLSWSMGKTIAGILIGQAAAQGKLSLSDKVHQYYPHLKTDATIKDVLQMSSGLEFKEEYTGVPVDADVTKMLYMDGPKAGFADYVANLPARPNTHPGKHFYYSSGDTNLLMGILRKVFPTQKEYNDYPWKMLFRPLGIEDATFEQDASGVFVGSSYVYLTANDYLKFGQLLMQNGEWNKVQIIPMQYMELMKEVAPGVNLLALDGTSQNRAYSAQTSTNQPIPGRNLPSEYSDLPVDALLMIGHQGQLVVASPSQKLVIVRLAMDKGSAFDRHQFFKVIKKVIKEAGHTLATASDNIIPFPAVEEKKSKVNFLDYFKVPQLIRSLGVKEYCSCLFVVGRSVAACKEDLKMTLPILPRLEVNSNGKTIKATLGLGIFQQIAIAEYKGKELGCTITQSR